MSDKLQSSPQLAFRAPAALVSESERAVRTSRPVCTAGPEQPAKLQGTVGGSHMG